MSAGTTSTAVYSRRREKYQLAVEHKFFTREVSGRAGALTTRTRGRAAAPTRDISGREGAPASRADGRVQGVPDTQLAVHTRAYREGMIYRRAIATRQH